MKISKKNGKILRSRTNIKNKQTKKNTLKGGRALSKIFVSGNKFLDTEIIKALNNSFKEINALIKNYYEEKAKSKAKATNNNDLFVNINYKKKRNARNFR